MGFPSQLEFDSYCSGAIACFLSSRAATPPSTPPSPVIIFNPTYLSEAPAVIAGVLVHEGTHFQQYLDVTLLDTSLSVVDIEFRAWWNAAAFWQNVRTAFLPASTVVEQTNENGYQAALQGEAALRDLIAALYT